MNYLDVSYRSAQALASMPPRNFTSISVPTSLVERLQRLRAHLAAKGYQGLPAGARPKDPSIVTPSSALEAAIASAEHLLKIGGGA